MTHEDWTSLLRVAIMVLLPILSTWLIASITGLIDHGREWLIARKQNQLAMIVGAANTMLQSAMENSAGNLALAVRQGRLDPTKLSDVREWAGREAGLIRTKMPQAVAQADPSDGALMDGVTGKLEKVLPPPVIPDAMVMHAESNAPVPTPPTAAPSARPDRRAFFDAVRASVFGGRIVQGQVEGCEHILDYWNDTTPAGDIRHLGYILATTVWETGHTMQPIEEYGRGAGRFYGSTEFYGRGLVQLTLEGNYQTMSSVAGCDLVKHPEKALEWPIALKLLFTGMGRGMFTGKKLSDYFGPGIDDPVGARAVVNGHDRADEVAAIYRSFLAALQAAAVEPMAMAA